MAQPYSARSRAIEPFHVMALLARANELQAAGHDVIHLEIGEPDFTTAAPIVAAGQAALAAGTPATPPPRPAAVARGDCRLLWPALWPEHRPERILITPAAPAHCCWPAACWSTRASTGCWPTRVTRATATSCAWSKAARSWCRSGRR
jgi:hypothetical protein